MVEILIKRQDDSIYWQMWTNTLAEAEAWVTEEKTRPYWDETYVVTITDNTPAEAP